MFLCVLKSRIVSRAAKIVFSKKCRDVKNEVFGKRIACLGLCHVGERQTKKKKKLKKGIAKNARKIVNEK